jgi:hypothetical protein
VNAYLLFDMARQRRAEAFRVAAQERRARLATAHREPLRKRFGVGIAALGATLQTLGSALAERPN